VWMMLPLVLMPRCRPFNQSIWRDTHSSNMVDDFILTVNRTDKRH